jgi:hypothetical protein
MTISRTARVWVNEIRNKKTTHDTANYFKDIFTKDEYEEFYCELVEQTKECVKLEFQSLNIMPSDNGTLNEIFCWMDENISYFELIDNIIDSVYTEMFQVVSGFFGTDCDDNQFEDVRDAMGEFSWGEQMDVYEYLLTEENPKVSDWMNYVKRIEGRTGFALPAVKNEQVQKTISEKFFSTELLSASIEQVSPMERIYNIINTADYDCMGITLVKCVSPMALTDYGFDEDECVEVGGLFVGGTWANSVYGNGVVVIRVA